MKNEKLGENDEMDSKISVSQEEALLLNVQFAGLPLSEPGTLCYSLLNQLVTPMASPP